MTGQFAFQGRLEVNNNYSENSKKITNSVIYIVELILFYIV